MKKIKIIAIALAVLIGGAYLADTYLYELYSFYFRMRHDNPVIYHNIKIKYDGLIIYKMHPTRLQFYPVGAESLGSVFFSYNPGYADSMKNDMVNTDKYQLIEEKKETFLGYPCSAIYAYKKESGWLVVARSIDELGLTVVFVGQQESYQGWMEFLKNVQIIGDDPTPNQPPSDNSHPQTTLG